MKTKKQVIMETTVVCERGHRETFKTKLLWKSGNPFYTVFELGIVKTGCAQCATENGMPGLYYYPINQTIEKLELSLKEAKWIFNPHGLEATATMEDIRRAIQKAPFHIQIYDKETLVLEHKPKP
jgi:hypothetical protein